MSGDIEGYDLGEIRKAIAVLFAVVKFGRGECVEVRMIEKGSIWSRLAGSMTRRGWQGPLLGWRVTGSVRRVPIGISTRTSTGPVIPSMMLFLPAKKKQDCFCLRLVHRHPRYAPHLVAH